MALETKLYQKLTQQLVMTPQLRMAIKILQVGRMELEALIVDEMSQNPVLEEVADAPEAPQKVETAFETAEVPTVDGTVATTSADEWKPTEDAAPEVTAANALGEIDWKDYLDNYGNDFHNAASGSSSDHDEDRRPALENTLVRTSSLVDHLMWQLRLSDLSEREQTIIGVIVTNLDGDGYLRLPIEEVAFMAGADLEETERLLKILQGFDPPGVAARNLSECLLLQLAQLGQGDSLAAMLVRDHLAALEGKRFDKLARELKVSTSEIAEAQKVIATLEPKPGRDYGDGDVRYVTPDVYIQKVGEELVVTLNDEGLPRLRVSQFYRRVLGQGDSTEAKGYIQDKMRAAAWLIKSIHQRQRTLYMVTQSIIKFQREFFEHGVSHLRPLVLKDVANDIGMHESTVSRATANKYAHTPQGIYELKYFFTSSLRGADGEDVSAESVRKKIKEIIGGEDPSSPFSDQSIAEKLAKDNIDIARRTVAKYRELMGILPSSKRRQFA
ncbi:MAG: RNA polymerase factor sigma-54 [Deltaproteobacteria bacterium]|nr:RNA polymerase factor sigma-54 [Deltaproteobacteria bacterium]